MKPKLLIVDDEPDFIELVRYSLAREGFQLFTATSGTEALHQADSVHPDLILLDLLLPDVDGFSVYQVLRSQPSTANIPVIVISALTSPFVCGRSIELGAKRFFKKPVDLKALADTIHELFMEQQTEKLASRTRRSVR